QLSMKNYAHLPTITCLGLEGFDVVVQLESWKAPNPFWDMESLISLDDEKSNPNKAQSSGLGGIDVFQNH
ncbi:hypothetical protein ACJX0J_041170, partial [Zea mays]